MNSIQEVAWFAGSFFLVIASAALVFGTKPGVSLTDLMNVRSREIRDHPEKFFRARHILVYRVSAAIGALLILISIGVFLYGAF